MNEEQRAIFLFSQSVCALLKGLGMISTNLVRLHRGEAMAYEDDAFELLIKEFGIGHNDAILTLRD